MKISFDLDGVIADSNRWFFYLLRTLEKGDPNIALLAEQEFYNSYAVKHRPSKFMTAYDQGIIITARRPHATVITYEWLKRHDICLPVYWADQNGTFPWKDDYKEASILAAKAKAEIIHSQVVDVHFDNNLTIVDELRRYLTLDTKVILVS